MSSTSIYASCIICKKVVAARGLYTHYDRTHDGNNSKYSSGNNGKYKLISERVKRRKIESNKDRYQTSPNKCNHCFTPLEYRQRHNKFCSSSCSAKFNNAIRDTKIYEKQKQTLLLTLEKKGIKRIVPDKVKRLKNDFCKKNQALTCVICNTDFVHVRVKKTCSRSCQSQIYRSIAIRNKLGGNKNTRAYGWYESPIAGRVWLESSYELIVARILDQSNIKWQRPKYIPYTINSISKKYYPDFYLVDHDI